MTLLNQDLTTGIDYDLEALRNKYDQERDRRVSRRSTGKGQYVGTGGKFEAYSKDPWAERADRPPVQEHTSVIVAGGGFGGLLVGARLNEAGFDDVRVIEIGGDFGGTWYWNRYPGAMCDIEAHIYLPLLEELDYAPKHRYSYEPEMFEHSQRIGKAYGLYDKALFQTAITNAEWREDEQRWRIETDRDDVLTADYFILACGRQSLPKLPNLPGIDIFTPHTFHSSRWDYDYTGGDFSGNMTNLTDKRVGIIGTGATAVQIVPEVAQWAKELVVFQRTPSSVGVRGNRETPRDYVDMSKPGWQRERRNNFQAHILGLRPDTDLVGDGWTEVLDTLIPETPEDIERRLGRIPSRDERLLLAELNDNAVMNTLRARIEEMIDDPDTAEALKPWYRWWCKRPCFHDDYLAAFNRDNVTLVDTQGQGVEGFTENAVVVGGEEHQVDCLIFATGFESGIEYTHLTGFEITGRAGTPLSQHWSEGVRTLHGMSTDGFPNMFIVGGNVQTVNAVNAVQLLDEQAQHIAYILDTAQKRNLVAVEPTTTSVDEYVNLIHSSEKNKENLEFYIKCTPGYYNAEGTAKRSEDTFFGGRYGDGALAFYDMLDHWRKAQTLDGFALTPSPDGNSAEQ
ncbi:flavin-containing monooxygenase [Rhodococcus sp. LB1]|uniref:flavin-containing monooxygenase n=1 Tax=Rhodococcus sp. LB1 TaxID=1807499 RepID=UPI0012E91679|nr:NAD(P)/FAD-dependent oxidoreductase [Rhodococcus sp. LB1]